jgi:hypothetical protein
VEAQRLITDQLRDAAGPGASGPAGPVPFDAAAEHGSVG